MPCGLDRGFEDSVAGCGSTEAEQGSTERRANSRYQIELEFELFHLWGASHLEWAGSGRTMNWSRNSILIPWDKPLAAGSSVELVVRWSSGVQLIVVGRVIAKEPRGVVVRILRRRFRGKPELMISDSASDPVHTAGHTRAS